MGVVGRARVQATQLSAASAVPQRSLDRLANLSDVRLLVSEVLTSIIEVAGADGEALLRYEPTSRTLVLQSYVLDGLILDIANNERLAQKQEVMPRDRRNGFIAKILLVGDCVVVMRTSALILECDSYGTRVAEWFAGGHRSIRINSVTQAPSRGDRLRRGVARKRTSRSKKLERLAGHD
jgi:hypothetical protein